MSKLELKQQNTWPYAVTLINADETLNIYVQLAEFGSKDSLVEANARPANTVLFEYLKLFIAAPEMYELIQALSTATESLGSEASIKTLYWRLVCLRDEARQLLAKVEGGIERGEK